MKEKHREGESISQTVSGHIENRHGEFVLRVGNVDVALDPGLQKDAPDGYLEVKLKEGFIYGIEMKETGELPKV